MTSVITGARALIKFSGEIVAFASSVSVAHTNNLEEIAQLDDLEVVEYAENGHRCEITVNFIKLASDADIGGTAVTNTAASFGFDHPGKQFKEILLQPELIIEIVDSVPVKDANGQTIDYKEAAIYTAFGAKFAGGSGQVDARGVWQGTWNFKARRGVGI